MFASSRSQQDVDTTASASTVDIAPLIDVVFILLIFFIVTTTFVRDTGLEVERPQASAAEPVAERALRVSIASSGALYMDGRRIALEKLGARLERMGRGEEGRPVVLIADKRVPSGRLVEVMDAAKAAGARDIAVAADQGAEGGGE